MTNNTKMIGRIIKVSRRGWGFISSRDIEFTRIFFHWTALRQDTLSWKQLKIGMQCEFQPIEIPGRGYRAIKIRIIEREKTNDVSTLQERGQVNDGVDLG